jgi:spermidine synthase
MPDSPDPVIHVKPYVHELPGSKALHFSISELQSRMRTDDPTALDLEYTRTMMGFLLFHPEPAGLVMIGLGGGSLAKFCFRHLPQTRIEVVEINPHVIDLRDEFEVPADDHRFKVMRADGASFVRQRFAHCAVLLVDGFDDQGLPARLCSQRFYDDCSALLAARGLLVVNLPRSDLLFDIYIDRIRRSFGDAVLVVDGSDGSNSIVFASQTPLVPALRAVAGRLPRRLDPACSGDLDERFEAILTELRRQPG